MGKLKWVEESQAGNSIVAKTRPLRPHGDQRRSWTRVVDLQGKALLPGFIDGHSHFINSLSVASQANVYPSPFGPGDSVEGIVSATAEVTLPAKIETPPEKRGDPVADPDYVGPVASPQRWAILKRDGCRAFRYLWSGEHEMQTYLRDVSQMPELLRLDGGGYANMSFILGCSTSKMASA